MYLKIFVRDIIIGPESNNIGPFNVLNKLQCWQLERHIFLPGDKAPFADPSMPEYDTMGELKEYGLSKAELQEALKEKGLDTEGNVKDLKSRAKAAGIKLTIKKSKLVDGYIGKPIGLVELLFRRGFLDPNGKKPTLQEYIKIAKTILDFINEKSEVKMSMNKLRVYLVFILNYIFWD